MSVHDPLASIADPVLRAAAMAVRLYAETHPRPTQVTQQQAAEILGVSAKSIQRYIRAGKLTLNGCGYLAIEAVDALRAPQQFPTPSE